MARDFIDWVIERWTQERPELDVSSIAVVGRLLRIADLLEQRFERLCREHGFSFWAAVTKRITRLEELGLVERLPDPADRRGTLVGLTPRGLELIDNLGERYLEEERAVIASLDAKEQAALAALLRKTLLGLEGPRTGPAPRR
jgi:DNA-binding HxlR family transcriptional regulator